MKMGYVLAAIMTVFLSVLSFIEQWVWSPLWSLMLFTIILSVDFLFIVIVDFKKEKAFFISRGIKFIMSLVVAWVFLGVAHNLAKLNTEFGTNAIDASIFNNFSTVIYVSWLFLNLMSIAKHSAILGYMPKPVAVFLLKYINTTLEEIKQDKKTKPNE